MCTSAIADAAKHTGIGLKSVRLGDAESAKSIPEYQDKPRIFNKRRHDAVKDIQYIVF
jgi:hypothetical protein